MSEQEFTNKEEKRKEEIKAKAKKQLDNAKKALGKFTSGLKGVLGVKGSVASSVIKLPDVKEIHNVSSTVKEDGSERSQMLQAVVGFLNQLEKDHKEIYVKKTAGTDTTVRKITYNDSVPIST